MTQDNTRTPADFKRERIRSADRMAVPEIIIMPAAPAHEAGWRDLWALYSGDDVRPEISDHTWRRILDPLSPVGALVAVAGEEIAGFLTYVEHEGTWETKPLCYVEDLYVAKKFRGTVLDVGHRMISRLAQGLSEGRWARLYGLTRADNRAAQKLYGRFAVGKPYMRYVARREDTIHE